MSAAQPTVGIDLGTTYSLIAYLDDAGRPVTIPNEAGDLLTPSAVFVDEDEIIVGKEAVRASVIHPRRTRSASNATWAASPFAAKCAIASSRPKCSALVLERLKRDAERRLGSVRTAVITVPAYFDELRRRSTQTAGRLAGLEVLDIVNEPTAAAISFGYQGGFLDPTRPAKDVPRQRLLVYDLGGGTFDVTVLQIEGHQFRTLATDGDVHWEAKISMSGWSLTWRSIPGYAWRRSPQRSPGRRAALARRPRIQTRAFGTHQDECGLLSRRYPHAHRGESQRVRRGNGRSAGADRNHFVACLASG